MSNFKELENAFEFVEKNKIEVDYDSEDISITLKNELVSDYNDTISLFYVPEKREIVLLIQGKEPKCIRKYGSPDDYMAICKSIGIEENNDFNLSKNLVIDGVYIRVFALTKPLTPYPNITISTAKEPPLEWDQIEVREVLKEVVKDNFLIVGASGSGKTYLMNFMLKDIHKDTMNKIGIIEEFSELFAPNKCTSKIIVPTPKPNEPRLLQFITEESNLMRLDYLYVGEIKGPEAWPFLQNLSSGTKGGSTVHGNSVRQGINRLKYLCLLANVPEKVVDNAIAKSIKYVIYVDKHEIQEISELTTTVQNGNFGLKSIWAQ